MDVHEKNSGLLLVDLSHVVWDWSVISEKRLLCQSAVVTGKKWGVSTIYVPDDDLAVDVVE